MRSSTVFILHIHLSSLYPVSGPIQGGTTVTISGIDLGVSVTDIMEILFGGFPCILQGNEYIPGKFPISK